MTTDFTDAEFQDIYLRHKSMLAESRKELNDGSWDDQQLVNLMKTQIRKRRTNFPEGYWKDIAAKQSELKIKHNKVIWQMEQKMVEMRMMYAIRKMKIGDILGDGDQAFLDAFAPVPMIMETLREDPDLP